MIDKQSCLDKAGEMERVALTADSAAKTQLLAIAGRWREMAADPAFKRRTKIAGSI